MKSKPYRILLGLQEIAGYYRNLNKGFIELGVDSTFINLRGHNFAYGGDDCPNTLIALTQKVGKKLHGKSKSVPTMSKIEFARFVGIVALEQILKFGIFIWALFKFDIFIFGANSSFMFFLDLPLLKLFGKKVIYVFHGSDSRPLYLNGSVMLESKPIPLKKVIRLAKLQKLVIRIIDKYADEIVDFAPQSYFHERKVVSGLIVGLPYDLKAPIAQAKKRSNGPIRILHCPSHPEARGTPLIRQMIKNLKKKGHNIDFVEIIGKPNSIVLQEIARCDFVIDEVYSDTPMAGLGAEAAFLGKPFIDGGYYADYVRKDVPGEFIPPSIYCLPERMEQFAEKLITNEKLRLKLGKEAQTFVEANWRPRVVAQRFTKIIEGTTPKGWYYDPSTLAYPYGYGLSKKRVKKIITEIIKNFGIAALLLKDKPQLEKLYAALAKD